MQFRPPGIQSGFYRFVILCVAVLVSFSYSFGADTHSAEMGKKTCVQCHKEITPDIVKQWKASAHGYTLTNCGVCHGDQKNFRVKPGNDVCIGCHSTQVEQNTVKGKSCATCHPPHHFTQHKVKDYKKKKKEEGKK